MKTVAIISAAGYGKRMGQPKQFLELSGKTILEQTLAVFEAAKVIDEIILVVNQEDVERGKKLKFSKLKKNVAGGKERQDSVFNGLKALPDDADIVAIHDGARPFVSSEIIENAVAEAVKSGAVVVGVPVKDTIKEIQNPNDKIQTRNDIIINKTLERKMLWQAQTPQVFKREIIVKAYEAQGTRLKAMDDAMLVEKIGIPVKMIMGSYDNIKITTPEDLIFAQAIIAKGGA